MVRSIVTDFCEVSSVVLSSGTWSSSLGAQTEDVPVHFHGFGRVLVEDLPSVNEKLDSRRIFRATPTRVNSRASVIGNGGSIHGRRSLDRAIC